jgi:broad specificity phosphatase PhoE
MTDRIVELLRHGEVEGGARFRGQSDDPLTVLGFEQMRRATADDPGWTAVFSSPARRCQVFASRLAERLGLPVRVLPELGERAFGAWEGLASHRIPAAELTRFWDDPVGYTPPGGEAFDAFRDRAMQAWSVILDASDDHTLVVTHGGVIRVVLAELLAMPSEAALLIEVPPACMTRLRVPVPPGRPSLMRHGPH